MGNLSGILSSATRSAVGVRAGTGGRADQHLQRRHAALCPRPRRAVAGRAAAPIQRARPGRRRHRHRKNCATVFSKCRCSAPASRPLSSIRPRVFSTRSRCASRSTPKAPSAKASTTSSRPFRGCRSTRPTPTCAPRCCVPRPSWRRRSTAPTKTSSARSRQLEGEAYSLVGTVNTLLAEAGAPRSESHQRRRRDQPLERNAPDAGLQRPVRADQLQRSAAIRRHGLADRRRRAAAGRRRRYFRSRRRSRRGG